MQALQGPEVGTVGPWYITGAQQIFDWMKTLVNQWINAAEYGFSNFDNP